MRYSDLVATAFVAGAMAGPHHRRRKAPCSSLTATSDIYAVPVPASTQAGTSNAYALPNPASTHPASTHPAGSSSSSVVVVPVPAPAPSGGNGTAPWITSAAGAASSSAAGAVSSALEPPQTSDVPEVSSALDISSAVDTSVTSSALPAESSAPAGDSNVPVGEVIFSCTEPGTFALTFDDGPFTYTDHVLDLLAATDIKVTFFVNGNNFGNINDFKAVVRRMIADGHQIGSHTYAHTDLATLGDAAVITAMTDLEEALDAIIGVTPTYMRPPYFSYNDQILGVLGELGYHVIQADIDTFDYMFRDIGNMTGAANLKAGIAAGGTLALAHDVHQNTAEVLTPAFIEAIKASGLRGVTVGECLGDPAANWYRKRRTTTPTATSGPSSTVLITSTATPTGPVDGNGVCGGTSGFFCRPGSCCSVNGFCGTSQAYCGAGCQPEFGVCGILVSAAPQPTSSAPQATGGVSPDGSCGGAQGFTCTEGTCCSQFGFCGTTTAHCGTGCQKAFGICK